MNNELKCIFQVCLLVFVFFITALTIKFCFSYDDRYSNSNPAFIAGNADQTNMVASEGRTLFASKCASCHSINKKLVGPALNGITDRVRDKQLLYAWIRNSNKVLQSGNAYFNALHKEYGAVPMTSFPDLTDKQIDEIIYYVSF